MGNCGSAAIVISDLWEKYSDEAKAVGCAAAAAMAESQGTALDVVECVERAEKTDDLVQAMVRFWNNNAGNSWAKIGPRRLDFDEKDKGALAGTGGRVFISPCPVPEDEITVSVRKRGGRGRASVTVCKVDPSGRKTELWDTTFDRGKNNIGDRKSKTLRGVKGHLLQVHLDGKSAVKRFEYSLSTSL
jgi:hypothetical protein